MMRRIAVNQLNLLSFLRVYEKLHVWRSAACGGRGGARRPNANACLCQISITIPPWWLISISDVFFSRAPSLEEKVLINSGLDFCLTSYRALGRGCGVAEKMPHVGPLIAMRTAT